MYNQTTLFKVHSALSVLTYILRGNTTSVSVTLYVTKKQESGNSGFRFHSESPIPCLPDSEIYRQH